MSSVKTIIRTDHVWWREQTNLTEQTEMLKHILYKITYKAAICKPCL